MKRKGIILKEDQTRLSLTKVVSKQLYQFMINL